MKAENKSTGHNRTIRITDIPDPAGDGLLPELTITVNYLSGGNRVLDKAVTLDSMVIPAIIQALNKFSNQEIAHSGVGPCVTASHKILVGGTFVCRGPGSGGPGEIPRWRG